MPHAYAFCIASWPAESGVHASAMGVHPGTKRMPMYSPARWRARRYGLFRRDFGSMHAACTPACMPARQAMHTHLRATYILQIFIVELIRHAIIQVELMFVKYKLLLLLNHHKHYECTSNDLKRAFTTCSDKKYQTTYSH